MMFAFGRDPNSSKRSGTARAASLAGRNSNEPQEEVPVNSQDKIMDGTPVGEIIARRESDRLALRETTDAELVEAAERMDAGMRLVVPMLMDGLGPDPEPGPIAAEIDDAVIGRAADKVAAFRTDAARDLHHLDKHAPRRIRNEAQLLVAQCDDFLGAVRAYFAEES